ncbi:BolA domain-containing protein [Purpureocillium lilacinum]|uniref:BolA domain-containing protein n=1 Tax=Purpureocillium lilacinum TaxID=33203 RepID=A0A2U3EEI3_PURLI|nr:BolA domain-containing protein [Purpureocillium lilacinum]
MPRRRSPRQPGPPWRLVKSVLSAPSSAGSPDSPLTHTRRRAVFSATASPPLVDEAGADINDQIRYRSLLFLLLYRDAERKAPAPICKAIRGIERSPKHRELLEPEWDAGRSNGRRQAGGVKGVTAGSAAFLLLHGTLGAVPERVRAAQCLTPAAESGASMNRSMGWDAVEVPLSTVPGWGRSPKETVHPQPASMAPGKHSFQGAYWPSTMPPLPKHSLAPSPRQPTTADEKYSSLQKPAGLGQSVLIHDTDFAATTIALHCTAPHRTSCFAFWPPSSPPPPSISPLPLRVLLSGLVFLRPFFLFLSRIPHPSVRCVVSVACGLLLARPLPPALDRRRRRRRQPPGPTTRPADRPPSMFRRYALGFSSVGRQLSTMSSSTPMEDAIRAKIMAALNPQTLEIYNDSHLHSHHKAMQGVTSKETHFRLVITSTAFQSKMQPARHRMVYALLRDEMAQENGIHALQLRTLTPDEEARQKKKEADAAAAKAAKDGETAPAAGEP